MYVNYEMKKINKWTLVVSPSPEEDLFAVQILLTGKYERSDVVQEILRRCGV